MTTTTVTKEDVYDPSKDEFFAGLSSFVPWTEVQRRAAEQGYEYSRTSSGGRYYYNVSDGSEVGRYDTLPDAPPPPDTRTFMEKVLAYVASPDRSNRDEVISVLNDKGFFSASDEDEQKRIVWSIVGPNTGYFCGSGRQSAREALGLTEDQFSHEYVITVKLTADNSLYEDDEFTTRVMDLLNDLDSDYEYNMDVTSVRITRGNEDADD